MSDSLKAQLQEDMKSAMRGKDKPRLAVIRLILSAVKQKEVDERIEVSDDVLLAILDKMAKQRRESISQFEAAERADLAEQEKFELEIIQSYLPAQLSAEEITQLITQAIGESQAESMRDMGKVMALLKPKLQGRADMSVVSKQIKDQLSA